MSLVVRSQLRPAILNRLETKGYVIFDKGDLNLNLITERMIPGQPNKFDDYFYAIYRENGEWVTWRANCTADPGLTQIKNSVKGAASLVPGQYRGAWKIGLHGISRKNYAEYPALVQRRSVQVYRDRDKNGQPDLSGPIDIGIFGINIHRATKKGTSLIVDDWSAGCVVIADSNDFSQLMSLCSRSVAIYGEGITMTLIETEQEEVS